MLQDLANRYSLVLVLFKHQTDQVFRLVRHSKPGVLIEIQLLLNDIPRCLLPIFANERELVDE